jgi:hypothetical protein
MVAQNISPFTPAGAGAGQTMNASLTGLKSGAGNAFVPNEALAMNTGAGTRSKTTSSINTSWTRT